MESDIRGYHPTEKQGVQILLFISQYNQYTVKILFYILMAGLKWKLSVLIGSFCCEVIISDAWTLSLEKDK